jgi:uncharacterized protein YkuJ
VESEGDGAMSNIDIEKQIVGWFLTVNKRFSSHFYHWVIILWEPLSPINWSAGRRRGSIALIRPNVFQSQQKLNEYLIYYNTFSKVSEETSFANYVFREIKTKQIYIVMKGNVWKCEEEKFNSVIGNYLIHIQIPTSSQILLQKEKIDVFKHDDIFGTDNYPFYPDSPLIVTRHSPFFNDPFIVNISDYPIIENLIQYRENRNDFEDFIRALQDNSFVYNNLEINGDNKKIQYIYKSLKILCIIPEWETILFVPIPIIKLGEGEVAFVGVVIFSRFKFEDIKKYNFNELDLIITDIYAIGQRLSFQQAIDFSTRQMRNYTIRASIAAIMGRNMSHNIGSHAIWHLAERLKNSWAYSNKEIEDFMRYLQRRMDFIAQVSTSSPSWCLTTSWNEFLNEFTEQKCLLDNIARSHLQSPTEPSMQIYEKKLMIKRNESSFSISIPHGQIGAQAFYVILEGLIRNAAKYGKVTNTLEFTITIEDQWDDAGRGWQKDFYRVKISDNLITSRRVVDDLNHKLAQSIIDPDTGELKTGDWGMKEIKICAAYLRMIKQEEIDIKFKEWQNGNAAQPPIIEVKLENPQIINNEISGNLTYVLYLLRPKEALIVGMEPQENLHDAFRQKGIDFLPDFKALQQQIAEGDIPRHNFLVLLGGEQVDWKWLQENLASLPYRILVTGENTIPNDKDYECLKRVVVFMKKDKLNLNEPEGLLQCLWENWVESWWRKYKVCIRWDIVANKEVKMNFERRRYIIVQDDKNKKCSNYLVFDHKEDSDNTNLFENSAFHYSISGGTHIANLLMEGNPYLIKEMAAISVAVIDERIWLEKDGDAVAGVKYYNNAENKKRINTWKKRRVYLQDTDKVRRNFKEFVKELKPPNRDCFFDFIIIHQGIIDEVRKQLGENEFQEAWEALKSKARWVIITTGRGEPEMARNERLRWVEYSNLAECLIQNAGDKIILAHLLWGLRISPKGW